ncbi:DUF2004 domain-containing protein [Dactylosporangium sp. NPDC005555]|uniref:DUF2004 domain-containing protein n=1 Tax=Dactylosporangium sp. NPDC005555 TaxID=3154889 RepID=UPI0033AFDDC9
MTTRGIVHPVLGTVEFDAAAPDDITPFAADLAGFDERARHAMRQDSPLDDYLDFDGAAEVLGAMFHADTATFVAALRLVRVGLSPGETGTRAVFDYTLGRHLTDHVVAVTFDATGTVDSVAVES